jgi:hypothetical protein
LLGLADDWRAVAHFTPWLDEFDGVDELAATITLIATRIFVTTTRVRASAFDKPLKNNVFYLLKVQLSCSENPIF